VKCLIRLSYKFEDSITNFENVVLSKMRSHIFLFLIIVFFGCSNSKTSPPHQAKPNIVLILVDDLGKEWVSCYGAEEISTPNIDALANRGTMFNNVYSMPQCTPTRVTLLTGQYPFRHGWVNHWDVPRWGGGAHFDENMNPTLGMEMKRAGYRTCIAGKWQIDDFRVEPDAMKNNGFDEYCMWTGYESGVVASSKRYQDPYLFTKEGSKSYDGKFGPDVFGDFIINFIDANKDSAMFIYFPMVLTHTPFVNTPDESASDDLGKHKAMVRYVDKITGEIVQALEDANIRDNTIIMWTTDNGTTGKIVGKYKGMDVRGGKSKTTEPGICAPFIVSWPDNLVGNQISNALIDFTDIYPTCLEIAGVLPQQEMRSKNSSHVIDGKSFLSVLLNDEVESSRKWILGMGGGNNARLTENGVENQYYFRDRVVRNKQYKLYVDPSRKAEKFFDLVNDPSEGINLLDSLHTPGRQTNFDQLWKVIESFPLKDNDPIYNPNPAATWDVEITARSQIWKK
jgi:arylsulfatase A-like enzyme